MFLKWWPRTALGLFFEEKVTSLDALAKAVRALDEDAGIRLLGQRGGKRCLLFVTRFGRKYTVMTYEASGRAGLPGKRLEVAETDDADAVVRALRKAAPKRARAYIY